MRVVCLHIRAFNNYSLTLKCTYPLTPVIENEPRVEAEDYSDINIRAATEEADNMEMMTGIDSVNETTFDGYTPLHIAAWNGCTR